MSGASTSNNLERVMGIHSSEELKAMLSEFSHGNDSVDTLFQQSPSALQTKQLVLNSDVQAIDREVKRHTLANYLFFIEAQTCIGTTAHAAKQQDDSQDVCLKLIRDGVSQLGTPLELPTVQTSSARVSSILVNKMNHMLKVADTLKYSLHFDGLGSCIHIWRTLAVLAKECAGLCASNQTEAESVELVFSILKDARDTILAKSQQEQRTAAFDSIVDAKDNAEVYKQTLLDSITIETSTFDQTLSLTAALVTNNNPDSCPEYLTCTVAKDVESTVQSQRLYDNFSKLQAIVEFLSAHAAVIPTSTFTSVLLECSMQLLQSDQDRRNVSKKYQAQKEHIESCQKDVQEYVEVYSGYLKCVLMLCKFVDSSDEKVNSLNQEEPSVQVKKTESTWWMTPDSDVDNQDVIDVSTQSVQSNESFKSSIRTCMLHCLHLVDVLTACCSNAPSLSNLMQYHGIDLFPSELGSRVSNSTISDFLATLHLKSAIFQDNVYNRAHTLLHTYTARCADMFQPCSSELPMQALFSTTVNTIIDAQLTYSAFTSRKHYDILFQQSQLEFVKTTAEYIRTLTPSHNSTFYHQFIAKYEQQLTTTYNEDSPLPPSLSSLISQIKQLLV